MPNEVSQDLIYLFIYFTPRGDSVSQLLQIRIHIRRSLGWSQVHEERILGKPTSITEKGASSNSSPNYFSDSFPFFFFYIVLHCINSHYSSDFFLILYSILGFDTEDMISVIWTSPCSKGVFLKHSFVMGGFLPSPLRNIDFFQQQEPHKNHSSPKILATMYIQKGFFGLLGNMRLC